MTSFIVLTPKKHLLARARKHVVWAIKRENRSNGSTWAHASEKRTGQSKMSRISATWEEAPTEPICAEMFSTVGLLAVPDVIMYAKFWSGIFRDYAFIHCVSKNVTLFTWLNIIRFQKFSAAACPRKFATKICMFTHHTCLLCWYHTL